MGRPNPCVLFSQTFVHPQLDEYVDEVVFAEPIVITACEFLEQNASSVSPAITLLGATSPPSFALEVFVQCEGETRFRRLCQPFLYSHSSSNVLEVEERGFLPLSAALLASSILRSEVGHAMDMFVDIASSLEAIILSLLFCRSGLVFLLLHSELSATLILALRGAGDMNKEECVPLRYASVLLSKGFFCHLQEVGLIVEMHLRVVSAIDRLLTSTPHSEEFLWVLWELRGLSRSECGRQALLSLEHFPEALSCLIEALHSVKELEPVTMNSGSSHLNLAIFHSAAEIFEVIVTDSTASSLGSWIEHAMELHRALHSSSPGSNRKDAPTRLLEWIDAGVVYHKNGAIGLLRYAAVLASGGDAHSTSTSILVSDSMDVENVAGESSSGSDIRVVENLGKIISEKSFDGFTLRDSSVAQLTTTFRILAFISENSAVAAALYDEGAITVIYAVLVNCRFMLERSSNSYDYLVDEGTECNSTSDLLLERNREQSIVDLLIPSLVLLIALLQKLQEANEQHRNKKLMDALLRLHREVSPKLAACAADMTSPYPDSALGFGAACHLIVSALACWSIYGWTPGLFHSLLASVHATSLLALGPKEACSFLCILNDLLPEEGIWVWRNGMPLLSALRTLAVGSLLGPQKERQVNWYLQPEHVEVVLSQLTPQLDKVAQIIQHYASTSLVVIQDMLRVFIVRLACQKADNASFVLRQLISWIHGHLSESSSPSDMDAYKVYQSLDFLASLLEHPHAKPLLLKEGAVQMLVKVLERGTHLTSSDWKHFPDIGNSAKCGFSLPRWSLPVFKSISLICGQQPSHHAGKYRNNFGSLSTEDCSYILRFLLSLCQILPVGRELFACLRALKDLGSCYEGRSALLSIFLHIKSSSAEELESTKQNQKDEDNNLFSEHEWRNSPPLLCCWIQLLSTIDSDDSSSFNAIEIVGALSLAALNFCMDGKSINWNRVDAVKYLFGLPCDINGRDYFPEKNIKYIEDMTTLLSSKASNNDYLVSLDLKTTLYQVSEYAKSLLLLLQIPTDTVNADDIISAESILLSPIDIVSSEIHHMADGVSESTDDYLSPVELGDMFSWECPETLPDRLSQVVLPVKRKMSSLEGSRRARGENSSVEMMAQNTFSRGLGQPTTPAGPTRRDAFRQRKPNTSRPPSMHVDDYVARERNVDGASSHVIAVRVGSSGGRPPSIHVDEFMARQRERQNPVAVTVGETAARIKNTPENSTDMEKFSKSKQLKADLDDELQGIDIVFDGEESESDDKLPFPQPDDNLQQPAPVTVEQGSPHSIVEETESDVHESSQFSRMGTPLASNVDETTQNEFSSRMSASRPEVPLVRESSVSSEKKYFEQPGEMRNVIPVETSGRKDFVVPTNSPGFPTSVYMNASASSMSLQFPVDSRMAPSNSIHKKGNLQKIGNMPSITGSQGHYEQKYVLHQPPLPPMPPPSTISPVISQAPDPVPSQSSPFVNSISDVQPPLPTAFQVQSEYMSAFNNSSLASSFPIPDSKYTRTSISSPSGSVRPPPPLPPTPPPYSSTAFTSPSLKTSVAQPSLYTQTNIGITELPQTSIVPLTDVRFGNLAASGARLATYPPPPLVSPLVFSRPASIPLSLYGSSTTQPQGENLTSMIQNLPIPQPSIQSVQPLAQLQPLQPPQLLRPPQPPQHPRPPIQASQQTEQGVSLLQSSAQMQVQPLQMLQQPQVSPIPIYYQPQQAENFLLTQQQQQPVEHPQPQVVPQQGDNASRQQQDLGMSLQEYFSSPEAIQSLLSDRERLCQLLEQHPKLMQMLQERLGQL
ncbi:protein virilizer homolog isoform X2 [Malania oleifera]|uniref:protein virilizer homolog isoform X2 n=1 Tax=Malania oleifera TaxID=397392 RepID=UPI0025AE6443|nr:protein virilizer homolog isoform X2 [Malania oleifera]